VVDGWWGPKNPPRFSAFIRGKTTLSRALDAAAFHSWPLAAGSGWGCEVGPYLSDHRDHTTAVLNGGEPVSQQDFFERHPPRHVVKLGRDIRVHIPT
jgi:hypothetical protein